jgi:protein-L-isoaspartate O-methyltransferase
MQFHSWYEDNYYGIFRSISRSFFVSHLVETQIYQTLSHVISVVTILQVVSKSTAQWYSKCHCVASVTKMFTLKGVHTILRVLNGG